ncbi:MAG: tRNA (N(6)-L-threonylcarbamoyladenosine(37)-C(2))-methylthiotransferase MtaB [Treponema sp.]|uniref:tRNA (N(6)-L-threonylcarbamoyladenosine(37)-C(2))- methylthiotransferase MtaB n=1 Tax=Treponema sp. TaxID=166 RepID=UPI0025DAF2D0|nr:tRNA (N(6)-L-threonylcarbamoyladenosine(37)-C(2))-methylthiotransferase MtaB [Treponema sp.]MBQ8680835.1 tRNA (N(6)-L-threonylcarbamoyladenosine(37)-C(2))-methylthiotransferase MtaB [Treponema sp.]
MSELNRSIHFETLGCRLNQVESEGAARFFSDAGFPVTMEPFTAKSSDEKTVLCVVNTCTVTAKAEQKARRIIRMLLKTCPNCAVAVTGCYAQLNQSDLLAIDKRICVLGGQHKGSLAELPNLLKNLLEQNPSADGNFISAEIQKFFDKENASSIQNVITSPFRLSTDTFINHSRSSLKIQDGCNCVCTYCRIRLARGKSVSLAASEVLERVKALEKAGQSEVVITTVNIGQYLSEYAGKRVRFAELLELILARTEKIKIRISSLYPEIVDEKLSSLFENDRVCPYFHISVQSGSDAVLSKMKRPYKIEAVYRATELLKKAKKNPFLACDIIAGFPGESDEDFNLTMKMLSDCGFTFVHAFPFSPRPGTEAFKMRPMVPNYITDKRIAALEDFNKKSKTAYITSFVGQTLPAVCETVHRAKVFKDRLVVHAVTENFLHCQLNFSTKDSNLPVAGSEIRVKILRPLNDGEKTGESDTLAEVVS